MPFLTTLGIDLGSVRSCVGVWNMDTGTVEIVESKPGTTEVPSYVHFNGKGKGQNVVGHAAKDVGGKNTFSHAKCLLGKQFQNDDDMKSVLPNDTPFTVQREEQRPYYVFHLSNENGEEVIHIQPSKVVELILKHLKELAQRHTQSTFEKAVISVPARCEHAQRVATLEAGKKAGFSEVDFIEEPTATSLAYGVSAAPSGQTFLVFDLGASTLDVSVSTWANGKLEILGKGEGNVGGVTFTDEIFEFVVQKSNHNLNDDQRTRLRSVCVDAKKALDSNQVAIIKMDNISIKLTRNQFNDMIAKHFGVFYSALDNALRVAGKSKAQIDCIVLAGGASRSLAVQNVVSKFFNKPFAALAIDRDEIVAYGATMQAAKSAGAPGYDDLVVIERIIRTIGLRTAGGVMNKIISPSMRLPARVSKTVSTSRDYQTEISVRVYEGDDPRTINNTLIGNFTIPNIPPARRGTAIYKVIYEVNESGLLIVSAFDENDTDRGKVEVEVNMQ